MSSRMLQGVGALMLFAIASTLPVSLDAQARPPAAGADTLARARAIAFPDTLGANFAIGDSLTSRGTLADYDALLGTWIFQFQSRSADGSFNPPITGHWTFEKKPGNGLIEVGVQVRHSP